MKIHYFFNREYGRSSFIALTAYLEENFNGRISYRRLEYLRLLVYKGSFQVVSFHHEFGKDDCIAHWAKNEKELFSDLESERFDTIEKRNYLRFRKVALAIYQSVGIIDFETLETKKK